MRKDRLTLTGQWITDDKITEHVNIDKLIDFENNGQIGDLIARFWTCLTDSPVDLLIDELKVHTFRPD